MPKIDARAELATVKGWATTHVILAAGIAFAVGVFVGALL